MWLWSVSFEVTTWSREPKGRHPCWHFSKGQICLAECSNPLLLLLSSIIEKKKECYTVVSGVEAQLHPFLVFSKCGMYVKIKSCLRVLSCLKAWWCSLETLLCFTVGLCCSCCLNTYRVTSFWFLKQRRQACGAPHTDSPRLGMLSAVITLSLNHLVCDWNTGQCIMHTCRGVRCRAVPCAPPCCLVSPLLPSVTGTHGTAWRQDSGHQSMGQSRLVWRYSCNWVKGVHRP